MMLRDWLQFRFERPSLHVQQPKSAFAEGNARWTNKDLDPVPPADRKWGVGSFIAYWISDAFNASTWQFGASMISIGLTWRESLGIVALSFFIISIVIAANGAIGALYHTSFPVLARAPWGFYASYIPILSRVILALFWFSIQTMNGAYTVRCMLGAIWPSFLTRPSHLPASAAIDDVTLGCFVLFWFLQIPFLCFHPNRLRWLFLLKSTVVPVSWIAILIWALVATRHTHIWQQTPAISGPAYSWAFLASMNSVIGNYATLSVNQSDFSRYSRVSVYWQAVYVLVLPLFFTFIAFIGVAASSAGGALYGTVEWDPIVLISHWDSRATRFFAAASFCLAALGVNISANSLSAANDLTALFPRYVNIRRGQLICAVVAWALVPWKILASAERFLNFMSAYAIFLGPVAAIMCMDFYVVKKRKYNTLALYQPEGIYWYTHGVNYRAVAAFFVGVAPSLPGFIHSINENIDVGVGVHPYEFGWLLGFLASSLVYVGLSWFFPVAETMIVESMLPDEVYKAQEVEKV